MEEMRQGLALVLATTAVSLAIDVTPPDVEVSYDGDFHYVVNDENLDFVNSGYWLGNSKYGDEELNELGENVGSVVNNGNTHFYIRATDRSGNTTVRAYTVDASVPAVFAFNPVTSSVKITVGSKIDYAKSLWKYSSKVGDGEWQSLGGKETDVYFPSTGVYRIMLRLYTFDGREEQFGSGEFVAETVDKTLPVVRWNGTGFTAYDLESGVDYARSYVLSLGRKLPFGTGGVSITYDVQTVELVKAVVYDCAGNVTEKTVLSKRVDGLTAVDVRGNLAYVSGYSPATELPMLGLYYQLDSSAIFTQAGHNDILVYVDENITPDNRVTYDTTDDEVVRFSTDLDVTQGYYTLNGGEKRYRLSPENAVSRASLALGINHIDVYVKENGEYVLYPGVYFEKDIDIVEELIRKLELLEAMFGELYVGGRI
ncbi:hypothetical protein AGMMS49975_15270 [Clostridia bacterium]|nr:hypothetical protein AGMMS49975_15270 [Clostridia bacterium]